MSCGVVAMWSISAETGVNQRPAPPTPKAHCLTIMYRRTDRQEWAAIPNRVGIADGRTDQHGHAARDHGGGGRPLIDQRGGWIRGRILDELCAVTGWHRKHAVRALASHVRISPEARRQRSPTYGATIRDALVALWEASDRICGKRLKVMISDVVAFAGAAWPAQARPGRSSAGARRQRSHD